MPSVSVSRHRARCRSARSLRCTSLLLPQRESIMARAGESSGAPDRGGGYWIGAEFAGLTDDDQRRLTRHVLKAEISRRK